MRFYHLGFSSLWSDEGNSWALLSRSFAQIARDAAADIHPPGYYWLLKLWTNVFGATAMGMRGLSALLGVFLVYLIYRIGTCIEPPTAIAPIPYSALLAALLAAINPFQIYYSQEARMYMLLALAGAGLVCSLLHYQHLTSGGVISGRRTAVVVALISYALCGIVGLWTHYSFPIILLAAVVGYIIEWIGSGGPYTAARRRAVVLFVLANLAVLLLYLPWLPTAVSRVLSWPAGGESMGLGAGLRLTVQTLLTGPLPLRIAGANLWLAVAMLLPMLGFFALFWRRRQPAMMGQWIVLLWLALPIGLMFGAGLFTPAFLKFLLTASRPGSCFVRWRVWGNHFVWPPSVDNTAAKAGCAVWSRHTHADGALQLLP
ncbi:MAG: hypothetical protein R2932_58095 [Caldilineaceae bacterium]